MKTITKFLKANKIVLLIILLLIIPLVIRNRYSMHVINITFILTIMVIGLNILTGYCGQISIGHAAFYGMGAYFSAFLTDRFGLSFWLALPLAGIFSGTMGYFLGKPTLRLKGAYLAIASIGVGEITKLVLINWTNVTGGAEGFKQISSPNIFGSMVTNDFQYYWIISPILLLVFFYYSKLMKSEIGRGFLAIKQDETAAGFMGINVSKMKITAFIISTFFAGISGSLIAHLNGYLSPYSFNFTQSVSYLMMVLAGGMGYLVGPILGVALLTFSKEAFRFFSDYQLIIYGIMLIIIIIFMPKGIVGILKKFYEKIKKSV